MQMSNSNNRATNWCFTLNYPNATTPALRAEACATFKALLDGLCDAGSVTAYVFQGELAPTTNTFHLQGFVVFKKQLRLSAAKTALGSDTIHLERTQGTRQSNYAYCTKVSSRCPDPDCGPFVFGDFEVKRGTRSDLAQVADMVKEKAPMRQIALEFPEQFIKYSGGIQKLHAVVNDVDRNAPPQVIIIIGDSGVGKTEYVRKRYPGAYYVPQKDGSTWFWQGYAYQEVVVFEEFAGSNYCPYEVFKQLFSAAPFHVNMKNASASFTSKTIVMTSNHHPYEWYTRCDREPLWRRLRENWCSLYFVSAATARAHNGQLAFDRIEDQVRDMLYHLPGQVLNDYLMLKPAQAADDDKVVDFTVLHNYDVEASRKKYGFPVVPPPPAQLEVYLPPDNFDWINDVPANQQGLDYAPMSPIVIPDSPTGSPAHKRARHNSPESSQEEEKESEPPCSSCKRLLSACDCIDITDSPPTPLKLVRQVAFTARR